MADYRLNQTGEVIQQRLDMIPTNTENITNLSQTKVDKVPGKGLSEADFTSEEKTKLDNLPANPAPQATTYTKDEVNNLIKDFITASVNNLVNYYLKGETYTKEEVQTLINAVKQFTYESVQTLPTASAATMNKIYLVPSTNPKTQNVKDEFITVVTVDQGMTTYSWEQIGTTTIDLSNYYTIAQTDAAITNALNAALASYSTTGQMNTAITTALSNYYTKSEVDLMMSGKQAVISDLSDIRSGAAKGAISAPQSTTYTKQEVDALISGFVTASVNNLLNYYLKSETYNRSEIQQLIDAVKQFRYQLADNLPTANISTMGIIYLIPSTNPQTANAKDEFITIEVVNGGQTTYQWEQIGTTTIDLSGYYTAQQTDTAITNALNTALANYATSSQLTDAVNRILFLERGLGKYDATHNITLQQATAGKYVNVNGQEVSASGYGISAEVQLNAGDIMLVPSASAVPADVSLFARIVTRTYDKVITYAYTYRQDYPQLPLTATADYNPALIYTAQYNESGDTPVLTGWLMGGQTYTTLPATREVTESYYEPLMKQSVAAMPSTGYYVYLCPTNMTIVVSGYTATVDGGVALVVGLGIFKNIATNFIGAPGQAVIAQAFAQLLGEINGLKAQLDNLGETRAVCINSENVPKVQNYPMIIYGAGAPSAPNVPAFIGQKYLDTTNNKEYTAFSVTNSISDWVLLN